MYQDLNLEVGIRELYRKNTKVKVNGSDAMHMLKHRPKDWRKSRSIQ